MFQDYTSGQEVRIEELRKRLEEWCQDNKIIEYFPVLMSSKMSISYESENPVFKEKMEELLISLDRAYELFGDRMNECPQSLKLVLMCFENLFLPLIEKQILSERWPEFKSMGDEMRHYGVSYSDFL